MDLCGYNVDGDVIESSQVEPNKRPVLVKRLHCSVHQLILFSLKQRAWMSSDATIVTATAGRVRRMVGTVRMRVGRVNRFPCRIRTRLATEGTGKRLLHRIQRKGAHGRTSNGIPVQREMTEFQLKSECLSNAIFKSF